jgi:hypothetical protein
LTPAEQVGWQFVTNCVRFDLRLAYPKLRCGLFRFKYIKFTMFTPLAFRSIRKRGFLWLRGWFACARRRLRGRAQTAALAVHRSVYLASHLPEHQWIAADHLVDVDGWNGSSARAIQRRDQLDRDHGVAGAGRMNSAEGKHAPRKSFVRCWPFASTP